MVAVRKRRVEVARAVGVEDRCVRQQRILGIQDDRQLLVLHLDQRGRAFGSGAGVGGDGSDTIAGKAHELRGQNRPVVEHAAHVCVADIRRRQHRAHAFDGASRRRVEQRSGVANG